MTEDNVKLTNGEAIGDKAETKTENEVEVEVEVIDDEHEGVPVDHGYAWVITMCVFFIQTVNFGFNRTLSVLLKNITEEFDSSLTLASLSFTIFTLTGGVASLLVSNVLMARFSVRKLCICGAALGAISIGLLSLAPSIVFFLLVFILKGFAFGILLVCPNSLMGYYFKKKRGLATSLCNSGFCVSYIIFPQLAEILNAEFGLRGCLLIMAAIELNLIACSMLLLSPSSFKERYRARKRIELLQNGIVLSEIDGHNTGKEIDKYDAKIAPDSKQAMSREDSLEEKAKLISDYVVPSKKGDAIHDVVLSCSPKSVSSLSPPASPAQLSPLGQNLSKQRVENPPSRERKLSLYASQQSLATHSVPYFPPDIGDSDDDVGDEMVSETKKNWKYYVNKVFDTSLFKIYCFRMFVVFSPMASFGVYLLIYMPIIADMAGLTQREGATLMTISGFMDLFARLVLSFLADKPWFSKSRVTAFSMVVLCVVCHSSIVIDSFYMFLLFATLVGVFGGVRQTLISVSILEYVGVEKFAKGFGFLATVCTLTLSINHPILGFLLDTTESFVIPLHYVGAVLFLSVIVILTEPIWKRLDEKRKQEEKNGKVQAEEEICEEYV